MRYQISLIIFIIIVFAGCEDIDEFVVDVLAEDPVAVHEIDRIKISFCLLNEMGDSTTVFEQGENFSFRLRIENNTEESLPFYDYDVYRLNDFCKVRSKGKDYGKPFKFLRYSMTKEMRWIFSNGGQAGFIAPWHDERIEFPMMHGYFEGLNQPYLRKGEYYTEFAYNFSFGYSNGKPAKEIETGKLAFRINFRIQ
ncbi:MAG: hypothetical protein JXR31_15410 [Prolixibacteraceae bacterium]|nr:hypothetical protein [Prolixibacteraceae bacterium]